nr:hypothetical protein Itr_chr01CG24330 [Ipomoea trifida]
MDKGWFFRHYIKPVNQIVLHHTPITKRRVLAKSADVILRNRIIFRQKPGSSGEGLAEEIRRVINRINEEDSTGENGVQESGSHSENSVSQSTERYPNHILTFCAVVVVNVGELMMVSRHEAFYGFVIRFCVGPAAAVKRFIAS